MCEIVKSFKANIQDNFIAPTKRENNVPAQSRRTTATIIKVSALAAAFALAILGLGLVIAGSVCLSVGTGGLALPLTLLLTGTALAIASLVVSAATKVLM